MFIHLLSSTEGNIALTIHSAPEGSELVEYFTMVDDQWWGYPNELYFEFPIKEISENGYLLNVLVGCLDWQYAKYVLQVVEQYRLANKGIDTTCTLQCALFDLQLSIGMLDSIRS